MDLSQTEDARRFEVSFSDDVIIEILSYLPLKQAIQCKLLSKRLGARISEPDFLVRLCKRATRRCTNLIHCSSDYPRLFENIPSSSNPPKRLKANPDACIGLPFQIRMLASCNGLVLLHVYGWFCVTNPVTDAFQLMKIPVSYFSHAGLAVDFSELPSSVPGYKLITVNEYSNYEFSIFSAEDENEWREVDSRILTDEEGFEMCQQPVYLHGRLHWLRQSGDILCFNVENEHSNLIAKPPELESGEIWFGTAQDMITVVSLSEKEILVHDIPDYGKREWRIRARVDTSTIVPHKYVKPVMFDGEGLFLHVQKVNDDMEIRRYDLKTNVWKIIWVLPDFMDADQHYVPFVPSLADVPSFENENPVSNEVESTIRLFNKLVRAR